MSICCGHDSSSPFLLTSRLLRWTEFLDVYLDPKCLPGRSFVLAGLLNRREQVIGTEGSLHPRVASLLFSRLGHLLHRPVSVEPHRETAPFLLACSDPWVVFILGRPRGARVPSFLPAQSGGRSCTRVLASRDDSFSTPLAGEGLVRRPAPPSHETSTHPALVG